MHDEKLMELRMKSEEIKGIKETLMSWVKEEVAKGNGCDGCHVESTGAVVDMIKDLAETEKECAEALYYNVVTQAMLDGEDPSYGGSMGYNHRHLNNGQFASAGRGHMVSGSHHSGSYGYTRPYVDQEPYIDAYLHDPNFIHKMTMPNMGYGNGRTTGEHNMSGRSNSGSRYGESYDRYSDARRHYTESRTPEDKEAMNRHAMEHVDRVIESVQEMWESSDDMALKKRIADEMSKFISQMKTST